MDAWYDLSLNSFRSRIPEGEEYFYGFQTILMKRYHCKKITVSFYLFCDS